MNKELEWISGGVASGPVGKQLMAFNMDTQAYKYRANATLKYDEWKFIEPKLTRASEERLVGWEDLIMRDLVVRLPNGMAKTIYQFDKVSDMSPAELHMDGMSRSDYDRVAFSSTGIPLPIAHKDGYMSARTLMASRDGGAPLDTANFEASRRQVSELVEDILFNGASYQVADTNIYGYTTHPDRNPKTDLTDWSLAATTGATILAETLDLIALNEADGYYGPYILYIPRNFSTKMSEDFKTESDKTIRQRLTEIDSIEDVKTVDKLTDSNVALVQMTSDVIEGIIGLEPDTIDWDSEGGMMLRFKSLAIMIPNVKSDIDGKSGVAHGSV